MMPEAYSEPYQKSYDGGDLCKNSYRQKAIFAKRSILDV